MLSDYNNNLLNINIGTKHSNTGKTKHSENMYYNIFSKKMETIEIPNIDLEFNTVLIPEKSTFMRTA